MAEESIKLTKTIYSNKSTDGVVNRSFSEFFKTKDPVDIDRFFSIYGELFYDIPKTGERSHTSVIKQSTDYIKNYFDPRDEQIVLLTDRIIELENQLNEVPETPGEPEVPDEIKEHPFYSNGTLIAHEESHWSPYYMDRGVRRYVQGGIDGKVFQALKASLGHPESTDNYSIVLKIPGVVFDGITKGPNLDIEDLMGQVDTLQTEQQRISSITTDNWRVELNNITEYTQNNSVASEFEFINLLKVKIRTEFEQEELLESLAWKYDLEVKNGFTEEEQRNARILREQLSPKILKTQQTLAILKRIWDKKADFPNINFDEILPEARRGPNDTTAKNQLTEDEVQKAFSGWNEGRNLFKGVLTDDKEYTGVSLSDVKYNSEMSNKLISDGIIKARYRKEFKGKNWLGSTKWKDRGFVEVPTEYPLKGKYYTKDNHRYSFVKYVYA